MKLATVFRGSKDVLCCLQETPRKMSGFIEAFIQGIVNFKTSALSTMIKVRCTCKLLTEEIISKAQNVDSNIVQLQCHCLLNAPIFKGFNKNASHIKSRVDKTVWSGLLNCIKREPNSDNSSLLELEKIHKVMILEKYGHGNSCREFIDYASD